MGELDGMRSDASVHRRTPIIVRRRFCGQSTALPALIAHKGVCDVLQGYDDLGRRFLLQD